MNLIELLTTYKTCIVCGNQFDLSKITQDKDNLNGNLDSTYYLCSDDFNDGLSIGHFFVYDDNIELTISIDYYRGYNKENPDFLNVPKFTDIFFSINALGVLMWFSDQYEMDTNLKKTISVEEFAKYMNDYNFVAEKLEKLRLLL